MVAAMFSLTIFLMMTLPMLGTSMYQVPVTNEWTRFWRERNSAKLNTMSSCPWLYKKDPSAPVGARRYVALNPVAKEHCLDLDMSTETRRVHSNGVCLPMQSFCYGSSKIVGFTCAYPTEIQAGISTGKRSQVLFGADYTTFQGPENSTKSVTDSKEKESNVASANVERKVTLRVLLPQGQNLRPFPESSSTLSSDTSNFLRDIYLRIGPSSFLRKQNGELGKKPILRPSYLSDLNTVSLR